MSIITLTSDMGTKDYYVAAVKGSILSEIKEAIIVDITHEIAPFNIAQASFVIRNVFRDFPKGSIHVIGVNPEPAINKSNSEDIVHVGIEHEGHYFIGADNGMFSLIFDRTPDEIYELTLSQDSDELTFPTKFIFAKAACHLARGGTLPVIGKKKDNIRQSIMYQPTAQNDSIAGVIVYIDSYGNIITNITRKQFEQVGRNRSFRVTFRGETHGIENISTHYGEVAEGNLIALFTTSGYLEIAINKGVEGKGGGVSSLFGLSLYTTVRIDFEKPPQSLADLS